MKYPKTRKKASYGPMNCTDCGGECEKRSPLQKYCRPCSEKHDLIRKKIYHVNAGRKKLSEEHAGWKETGVEISKKAKLSLVRSMPRLPSLVWYSRVVVPFSRSGSKNHIFSNTRQGHVFMRDQSTAYRLEIRDRIRDAVDLKDLKQNKLWIDIFVQKPHHRGDAVNFLDLVCDAIKDAIPLDDRWYSVRSIDWEIVKHEPMLFIGLGQEDFEDVQACSTCGRLQAVECFGKNAAAPLGVGRVCNDCRLTKRRRKQATKEVLKNPLGVFS